MRKEDSGYFEVKLCEEKKFCKANLWGGIWSLANEMSLASIGRYDEACVSKPFRLSKQRSSDAYDLAILSEFPLSRLRASLKTHLGQSVGSSNHSSSHCCNIPSSTFFDFTTYLLSQHTLPSPHRACSR